MIYARLDRILFGQMTENSGKWYTDIDNII